MKRFRLSTLLWLIAIAALCFTLPGLVGGVMRSDVEPEFRFAEFQRVLMIVVVTFLFTLAKRARDEWRQQRAMSEASAIRLEAITKSVH